jgi:hypothetical protein
VAASARGLVQPAVQRTTAAARRDREERMSKERVMRKKRG